MVGFGFLFGQIPLCFPSYVTVRISARWAVGHSHAASIPASELLCVFCPRDPSGGGCDAGNRNCPFSRAVRLRRIPAVQWGAEALQCFEVAEETKRPAKPFRRRAFPMLAHCMLFQMHRSVAFPETSYV